MEHRRCGTTEKADNVSMEFSQGGNRFTVNVSLLGQAAQAVSLRVRECAVDEKDRNLLELLFEELSVSMQDNLPPEEKVVIKVKGKKDSVSFTLKTHAASDFLKADLSPSLSENEEIEQRIRNAVIAANRDIISTRYNERTGIMTITVSVGKPGRNYEDELEAFYYRHVGNPPKPMALLRFLMSQRRGAFLLSGIIRLGRSLPMIVLPIITANVIDIVTEGTLAANLTEFFVNIGIGVGSLLLHALFAYLDAAYFRVLVRTIGESLRQVMVRKLQMLSMSFHNDSHAGAIVNKILNSVDAIEETFKILSTQVGTIGAYCLAAIVITLIECPIMALFYVVFIPIAVVLATVFRKPIRKQNLEHRRAMEDTTAAVTEMMGMVEITRAHGLQKNEVSRISSRMDSIHDTGKKLDITNETFGAISWITLQFFQLFALGFSAFLAGRGVITIGMIALFQSYFSATVTRLSTFINILPQVTKGFDACNGIAEILCADSEEQRGTQVPQSFDGAIRFSHVDFRYAENDAPVIKDFSLDIPAKSSLALVGGSGSGKTTIMKLILGFILPEKGSLEIDGTDVSEMDLSVYRRHLAVVPQHTMLFSGTIYQNLTYGAPVYVSRSRVMEVIRKVGLEDFVNGNPLGLDAPVTESGANLSGGQKQRLSIARALLRNPSVIILDEPTSALDRENETRVVDILNDISGSCTVIMVAHRMGTIRNFDSIAVLRGGTIVGKGTYDNLLQDCPLFRELAEKGGNA